MMELRHLRYFVAVADTLNFRRAAERVHIEQSPLSQQIRNLEQELGVQLFTRTKRRVELTPAGLVFVGDAQAVLARANDGMERARRAARGSIGTLSFAYLTSMTNKFFVSVVHEFQNQYPEVTMSFGDMVPNAVLSAVAQRTADVGFLRGVFSHEELTIVELGIEPLVVALPKGHRLTHKKKLVGSDLAKEPFVMVPDEGSMGYNDVIRAYCRDNGFSPVLRAEANQMQAVTWLVHLGLGLSLIPLSLKGLHRGNVVYRDLHNPPSISGKMVYRRNDNSPILKNFVNLVLAAIRRAPGWPMEPPFPRTKRSRVAKKQNDLE
jgi:DNA-binding transcriptional LysR family regulator